MGDVVRLNARRAKAAVELREDVVAFLAAFEESLWEVVIDLDRSCPLGATEEFLNACAALIERTRNGT